MSHSMKEASLRARFWNDETGFVDATNYILMTTLIGIGMIVGLTAIRDAVVQTFGDVAIGLERLDHTYTINCPVATFGFVDTPGPNDVPGQPPGCISICQAPTPE